MHSDHKKERERFRACALLLVIGCFLLVARVAAAQGNYEIQVYGADTVPPKNLMVELHSSYTVSGQTKILQGV